jgi:hypothetical protein
MATLLAQISWWRMTADFTCPDCGHMWKEDVLRHKDVIFPYIPFVYVDAANPYRVLPHRKIIQMKPSRCINESCDGPQKNVDYELSVPLEFVLPGTKELKALKNALEAGTLRMHEDYATRLKQDIVVFITEIERHIGKDADLGFDGEHPYVVAYDTTKK